MRHRLFFYLRILIFFFFSLSSFFSLSELNLVFCVLLLPFTHSLSLFLSLYPSFSLSLSLSFSLSRSLYLLLSFFHFFSLSLSFSLSLCLSLCLSSLCVSVSVCCIRRLVKRIYVPLPDEEARAGLIQHLMKKQGSGGGGIVEDPEKLNAVVQMTGGYSGSDLSAV